MQIKPYFKHLLCAATLLLTGCSAYTPQVEADFESNWQPSSHPGQVALIADAHNALAQRIAMIREAQYYIELTYFSWDKDTSGLLLLNELKQASQRGVDVKLVLDDLLVFNEKWLAEIATIDNFDIKIFNPFSSRKSGWLGRSFDFQFNQSTRDHRLHEKYFNVDGKMMILGGRNIGDSYFGYSAQTNFFDLDILVKGETISVFEANFFELWSSKHVQPIEQVIKVNTDNRLANFTQSLKKIQEQNKEIIEVIETSIAQLEPLPFYEAQIYPVFDSLQKLTDQKPYFREHISKTLANLTTDNQHLVASTPYIIPIENSYDFLNNFDEQDAEITILTNSAASNDSGFVAATWQEDRAAILNKGVTLYEFKDDAVKQDNFFVTKMNFHNKAFIIDKQYSYVGSSNFDPRSNYLNIELGIIINSPEFAQILADYLLPSDEELYWLVKIDEQGDLSWQDKQQTQHKNPNYSGINKLSDWLIRKLNIKKEL